MAFKVSMITWYFMFFSWFEHFYVCTFLPVYMFTCVHFYVCTFYVFNLFKYVRFYVCTFLCICTFFVCFVCMFLLHVSLQTEKHFCICHSEFYDHKIKEVSDSLPLNMEIIHPSNNFLYSMENCVIFT